MIRDRKYLDFLRTQACIISGVRGSEVETVDPAHLGGGGTGIKGDDSTALPLIHHLHAGGHQGGEMSMWREKMPDWLLRECIRAYARMRYAEWKETGEWK